MLMRMTLMCSVLFGLIGLVSPQSWAWAPHIDKEVKCGLRPGQALVCKIDDTAAYVAAELHKTLQVANFGSGCQLYWGNMFPPGAQVRKLVKAVRRKGMLNGVDMVIAYSEKQFGDTTHYWDVLQVDWNHLEKAELILKSKLNLGWTSCWNSELPCNGKWRNNGSFQLDCKLEKLAD